MKTMRDIALEAGVSRTTVSFVLNNREDSGVRIPEETRQRVLSVAASMGYRRNELVRAAVSGKSRMIGFLGFNAKFASASHMLESALDEAENRGYTIKVFRLSDDPMDRDVVEVCLQLRLAGVITLYPGRRSLDYLRSEMRKHRIPVALLDDSLPYSSGIRVVSDDEDGMAQAVDHLADLGHRRVAYFGGEPDVPMSILRERGYRRRMAERGLTVREGDTAFSYWQKDGPDRCMEQLLQNPQGAPSAILCMTDGMAMEAIRALRKRGVQVPRDISIVGFANSALAELADPPLTSVEQPFEAMGRAAVRHLVERIEFSADSAADEPLNDLLPTTLVVRESTVPYM